MSLRMKCRPQHIISLPGCWQYYLAPGQTQEDNPYSPVLWEHMSCTCSPTLFTCPHCPALAPPQRSACAFSGLGCPVALSWLPVLAAHTLSAQGSLPRRAFRTTLCLPPHAPSWLSLPVRVLLSLQAALCPSPVLSTCCRPSKLLVFWTPALSLLGASVSFWVQDLSEFSYTYFPFCAKASFSIFS